MLELRKILKDYFAYDEKGLSEFAVGVLMRPGPLTSNLITTKFLHYLLNIM